MFLVNGGRDQEALAVLKGLADKNGRVEQADDQLDFRMHIKGGGWRVAQTILRNLQAKRLIKIESQVDDGGWVIRILPEDKQ